MAPYNIESESFVGVQKERKGPFGFLGKDRVVTTTSKVGKLVEGQNNVEIHDNDGKIIAKASLSEDSCLEVEQVGHVVFDESTSSGIIIASDIKIRVIVEEDGQKVEKPAGSFSTTGDLTIKPEDGEYPRIHFKRV